MASAYSSRSNTARRSLSNFSITSTALSHTVNNIDDTKAAAVFEIGRKVTKCGYSGEFAPRAICRTQYPDENGGFRRDFLDGYENGKTPNLSSLQKFFNYLFYTHLFVEPRDRRVIIVESVLYPTEFRKSLCKVLLEKLDVPSILFIPGHLCATFPFNTSNALVVDMGYNETVIVPVAEGVTMLNNSEITTIAARRLEERVADLLLQHGTIETAEGDFRQITEDEIIRIKEKGITEDICVRFLFCTTRARGLNIQANGINAELEPKISDGRIAFGSEMIVVPGFVREAACEILFSNESENEPALPYLIFQTITKLPIDLRKLMFSGLLLTGGPSMIYGLLPRLQEELIAMGVEMQQKAASTIEFFRFEGEGVELYINWLGGSMFASLREAIPCRSISRQYWLDHGTIPDWTDFVHNNLPCGRTDMQG